MINKQKKLFTHSLSWLLACCLLFIAAQSFALANNMAHPQQMAYNQAANATNQLRSAKQYLESNQPIKAQQLLKQINPRSLNPQQQNEKYLLDAHLALTLGYAKRGLNLLSKIQDAAYLPVKQKVAYYQLVGMAYQEVGNFYRAALAHMQLTNLASTNTIKNDYINQTWEDVQQLNTDDLQHYSESARTQLVRGWMQLGLIIHNYGTHSAELPQVLAQWHQRYPNHPASIILPQEGYVISNVKPANHIALLLPLSGPLAKSGNAIKDGFMTAYYDKHKDQISSQDINVYDTHGQNIHHIYEQAANAGATMIVGPLSKENVTILAQDHDLDVPTLTLNYTPYTADNLYQYALSPKNEAQLVAEKAIENDRRKAIIIAPNTAWAQSIVQAFVQVYQEQGGQIVINDNYTKKTNLNLMVRKLLHIPNSEKRTKQLQKTLKEKVYSIPRRRQDIDMVFLVSTPSQARRIRPLFKFYYAGDLPIYSTSMVYSGHQQPLKDQDLNGIEFCGMPWSLSTNNTIDRVKQQMHELIKKPTATTTRLFAFGYDAYTLATELPKLSATRRSSINGLTGTLYLSDQQRFYRQLLWAQFQNGSPKLLNN